MNDNLKLTIGVISMIFVSLTLLFLFNYYYTQQFEVKTVQDFYSQNFDSSKKSIILLGTSHVGRLNATYIENYLGKNGYEYNVYNLGVAGGRPENQVGQLEKTLQLNPELIVVGIGFFDFEKPPVLNQNQNIASEEIKKDSFIQIVKSKKLIDISGLLNILANPKLHTLEFINRISGENLNPLDRENTPFFVWKDGMKTIANNDQLKKIAEKNPFRGIDEEQRIRNLNALEKIIQFYKKNNVDIILFITPSSKYFLNSISEEENKITIGEVEKISQQLQINQFSFLHKYENFTIFSDPTHVSYHPDGVIYSQDIAKIIIQELNP